MSVSEKPGLAVSSAAHVVMLAAAVLSFSRAPKFTDAQEAIPVEMVSAQDLNEIMRGDKTAKTVQPTPKAEKIADTTETKPLPPLAAAKRDVPTPPPPLKREPDPGDADKAEPPKPPDQAAVLPPPRPDLTPPKPPVVEKPPEENAEAIEPPKPVPRPKTEPPKERPKKTEPKKLKLDEVAKLIEADKRKETPKPVERPAARPKSGEETAEPPRKFSLADINKLLSREAPERRASTGRSLAQTASLGTQTANAPRMSPSLQAQMDGWFRDRFQGCWTTPITQPAGPKYIPMIRIPLNLDGSLSGEPVLLNPPNDPAWRPLAESAMRAVRRCNPLPVPDRFKPYYDEWRDRAVQFVTDT